MTLRYVSVLIYTMFLLPDFNVSEYVQEHTFGISELEVELDPITIFDDNYPEPDETFFLSVIEGDGADALNIFPATDPAIMTIIDNDGLFLTMFMQACIYACKNPFDTEAQSHIYLNDRHT